MVVSPFPGPSSSVSTQIALSVRYRSSTAILYPLVSCSLPQPFYRNIGICVKDKNALSNSTRAFIDHTRRWVLANFPDGWNAPPPTVR